MVGFCCSFCVFGEDGEVDGLVDLSGEIVVSFLKKASR